MKHAPCIIYDARRVGHRESYVTLLAHYTGGTICVGPVYQHLRQLLTAPRLLLSTSDCYWVRALMLIFIRELLRKDTVALRLRVDYGRPDAWRRYFNLHALPYVPGHLARLLAIRLAGCARRTTSVAILPFSIEPTLARVTDEWIYDPQFWDLAGQWDIPGNAAAALAQELGLDSADTRPVIVAIGSQKDRKGTFRLMQLYMRSEALRARYRICLIGKLYETQQALKPGFLAAGGYVLERSLSDDEVLACYRLGDIIWCCYTPCYNQSSGIFGRALQLGRPAITRAGSYIAALQAQEQAGGIALDTTDMDKAEQQLLDAHFTPVAPSARWEDYRRHSLSVLQRLIPS